MATKKSRPTQEHLDALAKGREAGRAIRAYLATLDSAPRKRGRQINWKARLETAEQVMNESTDAMERLKAAQDAIDAQAHLGTESSLEDQAALEEGFVEYASWYADNHGITYGAWRQIGVPAALLKRAGISR